MRHSLIDTVLDIVLDDTKTNNALDLKKAEQIGKLAANKDITLIVLRNEGRVFCSGGNLKDYAGLKNRNAGLEVNKTIRQALQALARHSALKMAYVGGDCFGGGIELLSCCDLIYAAPHAFFGMWQRKMSLSFGWGGYDRLSKRMNPAAAKEWLLTGEIKTAFWAEQNGLVDAIGSEGEIMKRVAALKASASHDVDGTFAAIARGLDKDEVSVFETLWGSKSHMAHLQKFTQRQKR